MGGAKLKISKISVPVSFIMNNNSEAIKLKNGVILFAVGEGRTDGAQGSWLRDYSHIVKGVPSP